MFRSMRISVRGRGSPLRACTTPEKEVVPTVWVATRWRGCLLWRGSGGGELSGGELSGESGKSLGQGAVVDRRLREFSRNRRSGILFQPHT
jgi:hypothetical protein